MGLRDPAWWLEKLYNDGIPIRGGGGGTPADPSEVNIIQVGGAATSLGRKAAAESTPSVLSTEDSLMLADVAVQTGDTVTGLSDLSSAIGEIADAAVSTDAPGTTSAKLRGIIVNLVALLARLPATLGQKAMASSLAVTIASDQTAVPTKDAGPTWTSVFGVSSAAFTSADASAAAVAVTDAPTGGQKLVITDIVVSVAAAMTVTFTTETSGAIQWRLYMAANSTAQITIRGKRKLATADKKLMVQTSAAGNITVSADYFSEA